MRFRQQHWEAVLLTGSSAEDIAGVLGIPLHVAQAELSAAAKRTGGECPEESPDPRPGRSMVGLLERPALLRSNFRPTWGRRTR